MLMVKAVRSEKNTPRERFSSFAASNFSSFCMVRKVMPEKLPTMNKASRHVTASPEMSHPSIAMKKVYVFITTMKIVTGTYLKAYSAQV